jgi:hypothetical protein
VSRLFSNGKKAGDGQAMGEVSFRGKNDAVILFLTI